ncbi:g8776 [Coccomyxa viridis]|uniref:G8776 protein n=1 Tax=Coccomyxa viridis TaxID=1274662 RepID=A0ABP1G1B8_9CHLO
MACAASAPTTGGAVLMWHTFSDAAGHLRVCAVLKQILTTETQKATSCSARKRPFAEMTDQLVAGTTYSRARTRVSYNVLRSSEGREEVARIERFVLVSKAGQQPLRLAVGSCYAPRPSLRDGRVYVASTTAADNRAATFPVAEITALLISAEPSGPADSKKRYYKAAQLGKLFFARHCHLSRMAGR